MYCFLKSHNVFWRTSARSSSSKSLQIVILGAARVLLPSHPLIPYPLSLIGCCLIMLNDNSLPVCQVLSLSDKSGFFFALIGSCESVQRHGRPCSPPSLFRDARERVADLQCGRTLLTCNAYVCHASPQSPACVSKSIRLQMGSSRNPVEMLPAF